MTVTYEVYDKEYKIENPYAIVLQPDYTVVRYGEKEFIESEYEKIINKIQSYDGTSEYENITTQVIEMLNNYGFEVDYPTVSDVKSLVNDYMLIQLPDNQEEFDKIIGITGYLKGYFKETVN